MSTQKKLIDEVLLHKMTGDLGAADLTVTEALIQHLRDKEIECLQDKLIIKEIGGNDMEAANESD